jgi:alkylation response protein AidB-like acyl-CoA dehydrogenase
MAAGGWSGLAQNKGVALQVIEIIYEYACAWRYKRVFSRIGMTAGSAATETLRQEVRAWLEANVPADWREAMTGCAQDDFVAAQRDWLKKMVAAGYATPHWPAEWPGGGRGLAEQKIIYEEIARSDAPRLILYFVALFHAACTLMEWASPDQARDYLTGILNGDIWCQGFSEPNAGSDLAAVKTRAERIGDVYVVNGQKTWSTMAQYADKCLLLVRTSSAGVKQAGLTYLIMDMKTPGITVRPIRQITDDEEFAEIFLDDVKIPVANRLGEEGGGWAVAQATLSSERGLTLMELSRRMEGALWRIKAEMQRKNCVNDPLILRELGKLRSEIAAVSALADDFLRGRIAGVERVGDASIIKLYYARVLRHFTSLGLRISGLEGQYYQPFTCGGSQETGNWAVDFMNSYAWSIAGGSNEVQRNIISERLLDMPREPKNWQVAGGAL